VPENSVPSKPPKKSPSEEDWQRQKDVDGVTNDAIDAIMGMIGLEDVKKKVLAIKARIDVTLQQGTSLKNERFNVVLLGNPGTGDNFLTFNPLISITDAFHRQERRLSRDSTPNS
jgi:hypothetical protein